jgi:hypothetical protein
MLSLILLGTFYFSLFHLSFICMGIEIFVNIRTWKSVTLFSRERESAHNLLSIGFFFSTAGAKASPLSPQASSMLCCHKSQTDKNKI